MKFICIIILFFLISCNEIYDLEGAYAIKENEDIRWLEIYDGKLYLDKNSNKKKAHLYFNKVKNKADIFYNINLIINNSKLCIDETNASLSFCENITDDESSKWNIIKNKNQNYIIQNKATKKYIGINNTTEKNATKILLNINCDQNNATKFQFFKTFQEYIPKNTPLLEKEPIDVLIKYIDLKDKNLQRKNIKQSKKDFDNEELKYCLRSIFLNIPWIRKIFILMPNDHVKFLKSQDEIKERIIFVKDNDLIDFDSSAINVFQFNLWKMKKFGMSENFILMDDDYFINKPIKKEEFFYEENGKILPLIITNDFYLINKKELNSKYNHYFSKYQKVKNFNSYTKEEVFLFRQLSSIKFISQLFKDNKKNNNNLIEGSFTHNAIPLKLSDIKEVYDIVYNNDKYRNETLFSLEKSIYSLHFQSFILNYLLNIDKRKVHRISNIVLDIQDYNKFENNEKLFSINLSDKDYDENIFILEKIYLEKIFNISSIYELGINNKIKEVYYDDNNIKNYENRIDQNEIEEYSDQDENNNNALWRFFLFLIDFVILISSFVILSYIISKIKKIIFNYDEYNKVMVIQSDAQI